MVAKLTRLTQTIAMQLYLVAESCTICSSRFRRPVRKLLDTPLFELRGWLYAVKWAGVEVCGRNIFQGRLYELLRWERHWRHTIYVAEFFVVTG
jgi:hypothetical protein